MMAIKVKLQCERAERTVENIIWAHIHKNIIVLNANCWDLSVSNPLYTLDKANSSDLIRRFIKNIQ